MRIIRILRILSLSLVPLPLLWWVIDGAETFTKSKRLVEEIDPLFGTKIQKWVEDFTLGLLPSGTEGWEWLAALPLAGCLFAIGMLLWIIERRLRNVSQTQEMNL